MFCFKCLYYFFLQQFSSVSLSCCQEHHHKPDATGNFEVVGVMAKLPFYSASYLRPTGQNAKKIKFQLVISQCKSKIFGIRRTILKYGFKMSECKNRRWLSDLDIRNKMSNTGESRRSQLKVAHKLLVV